MPTSSMRKAKAYSLTFVLTLFHETSSAMGVRSVVRMTSQRLMPSTPTLYEMPKLSIHGACSRSW